MLYAHGTEFRHGDTVAFVHEEKEKNASLKGMITSFGETCGILFANVLVNEGNYFGTFRVALYRLKKVETGKKTYYVMNGVGKAKYVVNFHDGIKTHKDGSPFFDCKIFSNKRIMTNFLRELKNNGYNGG